MVCLVTLFENKLLEATGLLMKDTCTIENIETGVKTAKHWQIIEKEHSPLLFLNCNALTNN